MPRVSQYHHYQRHLELRELWLKQRRAYGTLTIEHQLEVHRFYRPSEDLDQDELIQHIKSVRAQEHSLPNRVGKHYRRLLHACSQPRARTKSGQMRVTTVVHPDMETQLLRAVAEVLIAQAKGSLR